MALQFKEQIRIILFGKTGVGKSTSGNTILGKVLFHKETSSKSVTVQCKKATETVGGKEITVVDTPGWCDTELSEKELVEEIIKCIDMSSPGPHAFLLVLTIGRFTEEEKKTVEKIQEVFGEDAIKYTIILFTRGDDLDDKSIDDYVRNATADLKDLVEKCQGRYHVFNNKDKSQSQVTTLLQKIQNMVKDNNGQYLSNTTYEMFEEHKQRQADLQQNMQAAEREKEMKAAEFQKITELFEQEKQQQKLKELQLQMQLGVLEAENHKMGCVKMDLQHLKEEHKLKEEKLKSENKQHNQKMEKQIEMLHLENQTILAKLQELQQQQQLKNVDLQNVSQLFRCTVS